MSDDKDKLDFRDDETFAALGRRPDAFDTPINLCNITTHQLLFYNPL